MALNFSTPNTDFVQRTADSRRIVKTLVGDFTFDRFSDQHRNKVFLPRNMTKVLAFHDKNRIRGIETGTFRSSSSRSWGPILGNGATSSKENIDGDTERTKIRSDLRTNGNDASSSRDSTSARPDTESMSQDCLRIKAQNGSVSEESKDKRRSVRHQLSRQHEDKNAQLYLDLINIRKKLNFKERPIDGEERPNKRVRRESITCHCHVTIWDNRPGPDHKEALIRKSESCRVSTSDLGPAGYLADIKLANPFVFKSSELNVPLKTAHGSTLGIGDNYFLEIKIIPTKEDVDWPPVPVLGRSEGDQTTGLGRMAAEKLQGALVAKYKGLPHAPASEVPLSVFYLHDSRTYRSKYGLEVNATWTKGKVPEVMLKCEEEEDQLNLWSVDEEGRSFGRRDSSRTKDDPLETNSKCRGKQTKHPPSPIKVTFNIDGASAKGAKDFRKSATLGLRCPACPNHTFRAVEDLQFHFTNLHSKYKFAVEKTEHSPTNNELASIVFKISAIGTARPRNQEREPRKHDRDIDWQAPPEPLDVPAYVNGDQSWVEQNWVEGVPRKPEPAVATITVVPDKLATIRHHQHGGFVPAQKGGFLPAEHVSPFREPCRKKYPNIKLKTMTVDKETMYTSVSHRQIRIGEEARSESDDEMEDGWFVSKSLEALDVAAEKQEWSNEQRLLRRKWNRARLREKLSHPRYLSDCLIRFVRSEKLWLNGGGCDRKTAFAGFVDEFLQRRVINQEVVRDLWIILQSDDRARTDGGTSRTDDVTMGNIAPTTRNVSSLRQAQSLTPRQTRAETMLRLPPYTCTICVKPIEELRRHGVRCAEHGCEAPGVWYHTQCVRCKRKDKLSWRCGLCTEKTKESKTARRKTIVID